MHFEELSLKIFYNRLHGYSWKRIINPLNTGQVGVAFPLFVLLYIIYIAKMQQ